MTAEPVDLGSGASMRRYRLDDLDMIWSAVEPEIPRLRRWLPWADLIRTIEDERRWLERATDPGAEDESWAIFDGQAFAGGIGLIADTLDANYEIGYWLRSTFEGRGLVTRACRALVTSAFEDHGAHRVTIAAALGNARSRAVPERLGFVQDGLLREAARTSEGFADLVVYGMLHREWQP